MSEDKTVSFRVFLDDSERTLFKVACAEEKTTMSQKSRELISEWLKTRKKDKTA
jgi:hypothetical protein